MLGLIVSCIVVLLCIPPSVFIWRALQRMTDGLSAFIFRRNLSDLRLLNRGGLHIILRNSILLVIVVMLVIWSLPLLSRLVVLGSFSTPIATLRPHRDRRPALARLLQDSRSDGDHLQPHLPRRRRRRRLKGLTSICRICRIRGGQDHYPSGPLSIPFILYIDVDRKMSPRGQGTEGNRKEQKNASRRKSSA